MLATVIKVLDADLPHGKFLIGTGSYLHEITEIPDFKNEIFARKVH
jgi:hypothetical protein